MQAGNFDMVNMLTSLRNNKCKELMQHLEAPDDDEKGLLGMHVAPMPCAKRSKKLLFESIKDVVEVVVK
eukprot:9635216-Karenia_brevis.AAC.1